MQPQPTFLFDLDGTLTCQEILPRIAAAIGMEEEIAELTQKTIAGTVPYHASLAYRVKLLSRASNALIREVIRSVPLHGELLDFIRARREQCYIVTANLDVWVKEYLDELGLRSFTSTARVEGDHVVALDMILDKRSIAVQFPGCVAVGDGHNDTGMLEQARIGIACGMIMRLRNRCLMSPPISFTRRPRYAACSDSCNLRCGNGDALRDGCTQSADRAAWKTADTVAAFHA